MKKRAISLLLITLCFTSFAQRKAGKTVFILADEAALNRYKQLYQQKDTAVMTRVNALITDADSLLAKGPYSVTFHKTKLAPSNNPHDYVSQAPYWWADSTKQNGKPYIRRDGRRNPEIYQLHDDSQMGQLCHSVQQLTLAWYFTGNEKYTQKVKTLLQVWFIDDATRMNPNLNYAQYIPGLNDGRGIGIIETTGLTIIPDMLALLQNDKQIDNQVVNGVKQWYKQYLRWLLTSKNGKSEHSQINNHGTYYDLQVVDFALFTGNRKLAQQTLKNSTIPRIDQQFTTDGAQPLELIRTKSWGYATMNLLGWCRLAKMAALVNIDLWHEQTIDGKGIKTAINWLMPYSLQQKSWNHEQIEPITYGAYTRIVHAASAAFPDDVSFQQYLQQHPLKDQLTDIN